MLKPHPVAAVAIGPNCFLATWLVSEGTWEVRLYPNAKSLVFVALSGPFYTRRAALRSHGDFRELLGCARAGSFPCLPPRLSTIDASHRGGES